MTAELLKQQIDFYLIGRITLQHLEEWLLAHLQEILGSGDKKAIELANNLDADLVELSEGIIAEPSIYEHLQKYLMDSQTELIEYGRDHEEQVFTTSSESTTAKTQFPITLVEDYRFQAQFV